MIRVEYGRLPRTPMEKEFGGLSISARNMSDSKTFEELPAGFATFTIILDTDEPVKKVFEEEILSKYPEALLCYYEKI
jgi:hypothetical protein